MKQKQIKLPRLGPMIVLNMRRGRVFVDRKKERNKRACRKRTVDTGVER